MIGIFDSGLGGLTVVKEVFRRLPDYRVVYFGDTARTPYGTKGPETVVQYALEDADFLIKKGAKIIVIACNTASALAAQAVKEKFDLPPHQKKHCASPNLSKEFNWCGGVPVFEVIQPAVKKAVAVTKNKKIGVIGTTATVKSGVYEKEIKKNNPDIQVFAKPAPLLVPLVEEGWIKKDETKRIVKHYVRPLQSKQIDTLILGCTHYPFLKSLIQIKVGRRVKLVDSAEEVVGVLAEYLQQHPEVAEKGTNHRFFFSDVTERLTGIISQWLGCSVKPEKIVLKS